MRAGRPREFDTEQALDRAMEIFWKHGYEGATLPALTTAMGINRPSLYSAFGNKAELFQKCLDRYVSGPASYVHAALNEKTVRAALEKLFAGTIDLLTDTCTPHGCLMVQGALACGEGAESIRQELASRRAAGIDAIRKRLEQGKRDRELSANLDCGDLARYLVAVVQGLSVQASSGATRKQLQRVAEFALRAWPT